MTPRELVGFPSGSLECAGMGRGGSVPASKSHFSVAKWMFHRSLCADYVNFSTVEKKILATFHVKRIISPHFFTSNNFFGFASSLEKKTKRKKNPKINVFSASHTAASENPGPEAKL